MILTLMCGIPGSGKSTYAQDHFSYIVCPDTIRKELGTTFDPKVEPDVWRIAYRGVRDGLDLGLELCFDATNISKKRRQAVIEIGKDKGVDIHCIYMATPHVECLNRNARRPEPVPAEVIQHMFSSLEEPTTEEGFKSVVVISSY